MSIHPLVIDHLLVEEHASNTEKGEEKTAKWNQNLDRHLAATITSAITGKPLISWIYFQQTRDPARLHGSRF